MRNHLCPPIPPFCNHKHVAFLEGPAEDISNTEIAAIALALYTTLHPETLASESTIQYGRSTLWYQAGLLEGISRGL